LSFNDGFDVKALMLSDKTLRDSEMRNCCPINNQARFRADVESSSLNPLPLPIVAIIAITVSKRNVIAGGKS
jgi:hypothetical protein